MKYFLSVLFLIFCSPYLLAQEKIPASIKGNWLNPKNNVWEYGFYDHFAVINGDFWNYKKVKRNGNSIKLILKNGKNHKVLKLTKLGDEELKVKSSKGEIEKYTNRINKTPNYHNYHQKGFTYPLIKPDTFYLSGIIGGYKPKSHSHFINIIYDPLIENSQKNYITQIDSLGRFDIKFRILNPQDIMIWHERKLMAGIFAVPGEKLTIFFPSHPTQSTKKRRILYAGELGLLNTQKYDFENNAHSVPFSLHKKMIDSLDEMAYKDFRIKKMKEELNYLTNYTNQHKDTKRFYQQEKMKIIYKAGWDLLRYRWLHYGLNNHVAFSNQYLSFIDKIPINNRIGVVTSNYGGFLDSYIKMKRNTLDSLGNIPFIDMIHQALKEGNEMDSESEALLEKFLTLKRKKGLTNGLKLKKFMEKNRSEFTQIFSKYNSLFSAVGIQLFNKGLRNWIADSIHSGIGRDIMLAKLVSEDRNRGIIIDLNQVNDLKKDINNKTVFAIVRKRNQLLAQQLSNTISSDIHIISSIKGKEDSVFEQLIAPFKGKVVYIDFWAPWCGPCMSEMPASKALHAKMEGKDVIFLYLGVRCTKKRWESTINALNLKGEQYMLSNDEYALLSNRFQFSGIPRYVLVDKKGQVVNSDALEPSRVSAITKEIEGLLDK